MIEAHAASWFVRPVHSISIELAGTGLGQIAVPYLVSLLRQGNAMKFTPAFGVEEAQLYSLSVFREEGKIDTFSVPSRTQWVGLAGPDNGFSADQQFS
jgi:hypothetical protein